MSNPRDYEYERSVDDLNRKNAKLKEELDHLKSVSGWVKRGTVAVVVVIIAIFGVATAGKLINPKLNLYRSNTEKQSVIKEQEAISEAEVFAAQKRVASELIDALHGNEQYVFEYMASYYR